MTVKFLDDNHSIRSEPSCWPDATYTHAIMNVSVWRGSRSGGEFEIFEVPAEQNQPVLDVVTWIQQVVDPSLAYRYACRVDSMRALEAKANIPMELPSHSAANLHRSPAVSIRDDGTFDMGAVNTTASFRFTKWLPERMAKTTAKLIVGKGGMYSKDYKQYFVPNGAVYLSTVGYRTGVPLSRGVENVEAVHWHEELGLGQAIWVLRCNRMGPFLAASDLNGNCLCERENAKIAENLDRVYEGTKSAVLKRYDETDDRRDEVIE